MASWYRLIGYPDTPEGKVEMKKHSPITFVDRIKKPLIIFQGEQDPRVNKAESDQIVEQMKNKNLKVAYVSYPDEGHGFLREPNRISYIAFTEKFLATIMNGWFEPIHEKDI